MKNLIIILFALLLFGSCKKESTSLKVTVLDYTTNMPKANYHLYVYESHSSFPGGDTGENKLISDGYTDGNGQKDFGDFKCRASNNYVYGVGDYLNPSFNSNSQSSNRDNIAKGQANNITLTK